VLIQIILQRNEAAQPPHEPNIQNHKGMAKAYQARQLLKAIERLEDRAVAFTFHPMNEVNARTILNWRYAAPYDLYNSDTDNAAEGVRGFLDPQNAYQSITDERGDLVAYCCFGPDAWVPGGDYRVNALDIGMGMRPDLTGQGHGLSYVKIVLGFGRRAFAPTAFRVTVAEFNKRALRVWEKAGFRTVQVFQKEQDNRVFVVLTREM